MSAMRYHRGAVSIFVVIFTAMLITIVTVSFTRLMIRDQLRSSNSDLSQSAYDSALAGVEDAKRALIRYTKLPASSPLNDVDLSKCNAVSQLLSGDTTGPEDQVGDSSLAQAYTCVQIAMQTEDYIGSVNADTVRMVPLQAASEFNRVKIEWFSREDIPTQDTVDLPASGPSSDLPAPATWPQDRPPILETQLVQTNSSFRLNQFDSSVSGRSNANTLFLYPKRLASDPGRAFIDDSRRSSANGPTDVQCEATLGSALYSCHVTISLPAPIGGNAASRSNAYLRLMPRYNSTHFRVTMFNGSVPVMFDGAQPMVDATGRASNIFRRVSARVEAGANGIVYPAAAVDIQGNFCKTFFVADSASDYAAGNCQP